MNTRYFDGNVGDAGFAFQDEEQIDAGQGLLSEFRPNQEHQYESSMRIATDQLTAYPLNQLNSSNSRKQRIFARRGAFEWLPIYFSNDLVCGSWWFVAGSIMATIIPIVPLCDLFYGFWAQSATLPILQDAETFMLLIVSGIFFTLGSLAFVRATEEPPMKPLFTWVHFETDELLAAWLFLFGTVPYPAFMLVYVNFYSHMYVYWGAFFASLVFVVATYMFVLACYPSHAETERDQIAPYLLRFICKEDCWVHRHLSNDWLAGTWIFFYGTLFMSLGSFSMLVSSVLDHNNLDIFDWGSTFLDSIIFLIGSAYFCAGSYPQDLRRPPHIISSKRKEKIEVDPLLDSKQKIHIR